MAWIEPQRIPLLASGVAMLLLAMLLLSIDFSKRVNRAFAGFLGLRGTTLLLGSLSLGARGDLAVQTFAPYLRLAIVPLMLYFASLYPRRRGFLSRPGMGWLVLAAIVALDAAYFLDHGLFYTVAEGPAATPIQTATGSLQYSSFGPLAVVGFSLTPLAAGLGVLFARDYTRSDEGTQRTSYFLVAAGFLLNGLFDGSQQVVGLTRLLADAGGYPWLPWGWSFAVLPSLALLPALAGFAMIARHRFQGRAIERRLESRRERLLFALAALAVATGVSPLLMPGSEFFAHPAGLVLLGLWRLTLPLFVTYALLRYALFDIDLKVRAAVAWSFVVVVFASVYFLVSETLEGLVSDRFGTVGGLAAAALLTVAGGPLAALGKTVAKALMPGVRDLREVPADASSDIYRQQFLMLQEDGSLTAKERRSLDELRQRLGLAPKRASAIEALALASLGQSAAKPAAAPS